jgi:5-methylcytosine-specific restriction endonuclease McrA
LQDAHIVGTTATAVVHSSVAELAVKKAKRPRSAAALRADVWEHTMGARVEGTCRLCEACVIYRDRRLGFEVAHVVAAVHGGAAIPDNLIATCAACNNSMAGEDMPSWITRTVRDGTRRVDLLAFVAAPRVK